MAGTVALSPELGAELRDGEDLFNDTVVAQCGEAHIPSRETPLIWQRLDGRRTLVTGATGGHIVGVRREDSRAVIDELEAWATQKRFCDRHDWVAGVVIWEDAGMLHRILPYGRSSQRAMHRTTIAGNEAWT